MIEPNDIVIMNQIRKLTEQAYEQAKIEDNPYQLSVNYSGHVNMLRCYITKDEEEEVEDIYKAELLMFLSNYEMEDIVKLTNDYYAKVQEIILWEL